MQILKTAQYLRFHGISVAMNSAAAQLGKFDLIHLWGLSPTETVYPVFLRAVHSTCPVVLSPIYWDLRRYYETLGSVQRLKLWEEHRPLRGEIAAGSAQVFVSGRKEGEALAKDVGIPISCTVVPCGINDGFWTGERPQNRRGILCAARIGPRKNQMALAQQCAQRGLALTLAGTVENEAYFAQCLRYSNVRYVGTMSARQLAALYQKSRVHALTGYAETPGLASLEAAACGCEIVTTGEGTAEEYFGENASYCDPYEPDSIGAAIDVALSQNRQPCLQNAISKKFTWGQCLQPLLEAYESLV